MFLLQTMWEFLITLWRSHRGNLDPIWSPKNVFLFNFTRILWFFWDVGLTLFDIPKDAVFAKILVFSNIYGFPAANCAPKWNKTVNFGCLPFKLKFKILKDFSNTLFVLLETDNLWSKFQQDWTMFGGARAQKTKKGPFHWMLNQCKKLWKFLTSQPQMLYWWNLPQILMKRATFIW